jgi:LuxR family maltose regulon positive regulatory protein
VDQAFVYSKDALAIGEDGEFVRIFVDGGQPMARLLRETLDRGVAPDYVRRLLAAFPSEKAESASVHRSPSPANELVEPLSEREVEVLQLIAGGLTNREIADQLYLSLNTVKVHTRNIYGKLDVHNRTEAVAKARALSLLR